MYTNWHSQKQNSFWPKFCFIRAKSGRDWYKTKRFPGQMEICQIFDLYQPCFDFEHHFLWLNLKFYINIEYNSLHDWLLSNNCKMIMIVQNFHMAGQFVKRQLMIIRITFMNEAYQKLSLNNFNLNSSNQNNYI